MPSRSHNQEDPLEGLPPIVRHDLPRVFKLRNALDKLITEHLVNSESGSIRKLDFEAVEELAKAVGRVIGGRARDNREALCSFFLPFSTTSRVGITAKDIRKLAWRIAGNYRVIRDGGGLLRRPTFQPGVWAPFEIRRVDRAVSRHGQVGYELQLLFLAGMPATQEMILFRPDDRLRSIISALGFSRMRSGKVTIHSKPQTRLFISPYHFTRLRAYALVDPGVAGDDRRQPRVVKIHPTPACLRHNRELMDRRDRLKPGYDCPEKQPLSFPCHNCPLGYSDCPAGCHPATYVLIDCPRCNRAERLADPTNVAGICRSCERNEKLQRK